MAKAYIILGGNIGNVQANFSRAEKQIEKLIGPIWRTSSIYKTAAWGYNDQPDFLNKIIISETMLSPYEVMQQCLGIEKKLGRRRDFKNAPRTIDIDLLFLDKEVIDMAGLQLPHPRIAERKFVLVPLNELSPNFKHPVSGKTIHQLLTDCGDPLPVAKI